MLPYFRRNTYHQRACFNDKSLSIWPIAYQSKITYQVFEHLVALLLSNFRNFFSWRVSILFSFVSNFLYFNVINYNVLLKYGKNVFKQRYDISIMLIHIVQNLYLHGLSHSNTSISLHQCSMISEEKIHKMVYHCEYIR